jgi:hypothetical protein
MQDIYLQLLCEISRSLKMLSTTKECSDYFQKWVASDEVQTLMKNDGRGGGTPMFESDIINTVGSVPTKYGIGNKSAIYFVLGVCCFYCNRYDKEMRGTVRVSKL